MAVMSPTIAGARVMQYLRASHTAEEHRVAKLEENPRRSKKKPTPAQLRARAEFARRFGGKKMKRRSRKVAENATAAPAASTPAPKLQQNRRRARRADSLQENRRRRRARASASLQENVQYEENPMAQAQLNENPRRKRRGKKRRRARGRRRAAARSPFQAALDSASGGGRRRRRRSGGKKRRSSGRRRRSGRRRSTRRKASSSRRRSRVAKAHIVRLPATKSAQVQVIEVTRRRRSGGKRRRKSTGRRRRSGRRRSRRMELMENPGLFSGGGPPVLYENQAGAFSAASLRSYGVAAFGVGLGLIVADVTDRFVATRTPKDGKNPWMGKDAAAVYRSRPDAWRLAAQAGGAVVGIGGAYMARGRGVLPFALGGIAVGFGANLMKMLWDWYAAPAILKVGPNDWGKPSLGSRLYPLEQASIQDTVSQLIAKWQTTPSLAGGQQTPPQISPPMSAGGSLYALGRPNAMQAVGNGQQARVLKNTGRLGNCTHCGGHNGCYNDCPTQCSQCPEYNRNTECKHVVSAGEDITVLAAQAGVTVDQIAAMNGGGPVEAFWVAGNTVRLPYGACLAIENGTFTPVQPPTQIPTELVSTPVVPPVTFQDTGPIMPAAPASNVVAGLAGSEAIDQDMVRRSLAMAGAGRM